MRSLHSRLTSTQPPSGSVPDLVSRPAPGQKIPKRKAQESFSDSETETDTDDEGYRGPKRRADKTATSTTAEDKIPQSFKALAQSIPLRPIPKEVQLDYSQRMMPDSAEARKEDK